MPFHYYVCPLVAAEKKDIAGNVTGIRQAPLIDSLIDDWLNRKFPGDTEDAARARAALGAQIAWASDEDSILGGKLYILGLHAPQEFHDFVLTSPDVAEAMDQTKVNQVYAKYGHRPAEMSGKNVEQALQIIENNKAGTGGRSSRRMLLSDLKAKGE